MPAHSPEKHPHDLGALLRGWRAARRQSQLDLSLNAGISQRHYSFVESGRSAPSRDLVVRIAEALTVPYRDRNVLLLAAGYAPVYTEDPWDGRALEHVRSALHRVLAQQEPYPALVMDRYWNVVMTNEAAPRLFGHFVDLAAHPKPRNLLHLMFDPAGLRPRIVDWETLARTLIARLHREAVGGLLDEQGQALLDALLAYPGTRPEWRLPTAGAGPVDLPVMPVRLEWQGHTLSYFSMLTTLAAPQALTTQEMRIECMFPNDALTERLHAQVMLEPPAAG